MAVITGTNRNNTLTGTNGNDILRGLAGNDTLRGLAGNDVLDGGVGSDSMTGGLGRDVFVVDSAGDRIFESPGGGTDSVHSSISFSLAALLENLVLIGTGNTSGNGNSVANAIRGNDGSNILRGFGGDDSLSGRGGNDRLEGGAGDDRMTGGTGNDVFIVGNAGDRVVEAARGGRDLVLSSRDFNLAATPQVENLTLTGSAAIDGTGNNLANLIIGNNAHNVLNGGGGNDILIGRGGSSAAFFEGDNLIGGAGADIFRYLSIADSPGDDGNQDDNIDFSQAQNDRIDLRAIDANTLTAGNGSFTFIGTANFTAPGQVRYLNVPNPFIDDTLTIVLANVDADLAADFRVNFITVNGSTTMVAGDFML
jgi:Ca2+-binding RTX toxin-like protein